MPSRPPRLLTRNRLLLCILINQLATPGLGSLMAGRRIAGTGQLALALAGVALILDWMFQFFRNATLRNLGEPVTANPPDWMWTWGLILFGVSWLWSLFTSLQLWGKAKQLPEGG